MQQEARAPTRLDEEVKNHVVLIAYDPVTRSLINKLTHYHYAYVLIVPDLEQALHYHDLGIDVIYGELDDPDTFHRARIEQAALVAVTATGMPPPKKNFTPG